MRADAVSFNENIVEQVDLVMTGEQPVQVFLKLSGYFNYSCGNVLIVNHGRAKYMDKPQYVSRFEVTVSSYNQFSGSEVEAPCRQMASYIHSSCRWKCMIYRLVLMNMQSMAHIQERLN
ncbi:hypothetical protein SAMN06296273_2919 [Nitrosomonas ureae]|uniref:Uncharacterized protein n=1 Tax=Nitrosomonas ureae TaxID=44577 RepID=A0A285C1W8_9PROT|nr:hypothetical protein SAMN06296273_2919 [Nitrosomonas ureae]